MNSVWEDQGKCLKQKESDHVLPLLFTIRKNLVILPILVQPMKFTIHLFLQNTCFPCGEIKFLFIPLANYSNVAFNQSDDSVYVEWLAENKQTASFFGCVSAIDSIGSVVKKVAGYSISFVN